MPVWQGSHGADSVISEDVNYSDDFESGRESPDRGGSTVGESIGEHLSREGRLQDDSVAEEIGDSIMDEYGDDTFEEPSEVIQEGIEGSQSRADSEISEDFRSSGVSEEENYDDDFESPPGSEIKRGSVSGLGLHSIPEVDEVDDSIADELGGASMISDDIGEDIERSQQSNSIVDEVDDGTEELLSPSSRYRDDTFEEDDSYGQVPCLPLPRLLTSPRLTLL